MPQVFKMGPYLVYFWSNENEPLEPVHVHVSQGVPSKNSTKVWLTKNGGALLANNDSEIPLNVLRNIMGVLEARHEYVAERWLRHFGEIRYYC